MASAVEGPSRTLLLPPSRRPRAPAWPGSCASCSATHRAGELDPRITHLVTPGTLSWDSGTWWYLPCFCSTPLPCWALRCWQSLIVFLLLSFRLWEWPCPSESEVYWPLAIASASASYSIWQLAASRADWDQEEGSRRASWGSLFPAWVGRWTCLRPVLASAFLPLRWLGHRSLFRPWLGPEARGETGWASNGTKCLIRLRSGLALGPAWLRWHLRVQMGTPECGRRSDWEVGFGLRHLFLVRCLRRRLFLWYCVVAAWYRGRCASQ